MILRVILAVVWWIGLWYWIAHIKYWNTEHISAMKKNYKELQDTHQSLQNQHTQLTAAQELIKVKAKELVAQNEDYAKIISQLNRYYYKLKDIRMSIEEIRDSLWPMDVHFEKKLDTIQNTSPLSPPEFHQHDTTESKLQR